MILIERSSKIPKSLVKPPSKFVANDYKKRDVRQALKDMQHYKCCYCEQSFLKLEEIEIEGEHIIPQSAKVFINRKKEKQWNLINDWNNILLACRPCNGKKLANYIDPQLNIKIIDPSNSQINPEDEIKFKFINEDIILYDMQKSSVLGKATIEIIGLHQRFKLRSTFRNIKRNIAKTLDYLITAIERKNKVEVHRLLNELKDCTKASVPHASLTRTIIKLKLKMLSRAKCSISNIDTYRVEIKTTLKSLYTGHEY